jgi:hypothetical protein
MQLGSVCSTHGGLPGLKVCIKPDLAGIPSTQETKKVVSWGNFHLVPPDALSKINGDIIRARALQKSHGMPFPHLDSTVFVPAAQLPLLAADQAKLLSEFDEHVEDFLATYYTIREEWAPTLEKAIRDVARTPEDAERCIEYVVAQYPTVEYLRARFYLTFDVFAITSDQTGMVPDVMRKEAERVRDTITGMLTGLRDDCKAALENLMGYAQKGARLHGKTINATMAIMDRLENLNGVFQDEILSRQIAVIRKLCDDVSSAKEISDAEGDKATAGILPTLETAKAALEDDVVEASAKAEARLTSVGKRKLNIV